MGQITVNGIEIQRYQEVLASIVASEQALIDANISTEDDEVLGQLNQIIANAIASQESLAEAVYYSFYLPTAEGVSLDNLVALLGIKRLEATPSSTTDQKFVGSNGTSIPAGSIIQNPINGNRVLTTNTINLDVSNCYSSKYSVKTLLNLTEYTLTVNGNLVSFTSDADATELEILNGLKADNDTNYPSATWTMTVDTVNLQLEIVTTGSNIAISSTTYIGPDEVVIFGNAESEVTGPIIFPADSVTGIVTAVSGWVSTTNTTAYILGRERETDEELRLRAATSQQINATATVEAIQGSLRNVDGVTTAIVEENDTHLFSGGSNVVTFTNATNTVDWTAHTLNDGDAVQFTTTGTLPTGLSPETIQYWVINSTVNDFQVSLTQGGPAVTFTDDGTLTTKVLIGRPPHSFEAVVQGGTDEDVATAIWEDKAAGIQTFGSTTEVIQDVDGVDRTIKFSRPTAVSLSFDVNLTQHPEENLPLNYEQAVKDTIVAVTESLGVGVDVVPSRYFGPIYLNSTGFYIDSITVDTIPSTSPTEDLLPISNTEFATVDESDITVSII